MNFESIEDPRWSRCPRPGCWAAVAARTLPATRPWSRPPSRRRSHSQVQPRLERRRCPNKSRPRSFHPHLYRHQHRDLHRTGTSTALHRHRHPHRHPHPHRTRTRTRTSTSTSTSTSTGAGTSSRPIRGTSCKRWLGAVPDLGRWQRSQPRLLEPAPAAAMEARRHGRLDRRDGQSAGNGALRFGDGAHSRDWTMRSMPPNSYVAGCAPGRTRASCSGQRQEQSCRRPGAAGFRIIRRC